MSMLLLTACTRFVQPDAAQLVEQIPEKKQLLYSRSLSQPLDTQDWIMEGPGEVGFENGWMQMHSPNQAMHHVYWCPQDFPDSFIAQWQAQSLYDEAGLVIVFFAAKGTQGEDIFDSQLPPRDGTFTQYTQGSINSYHISYYANAAHNLGREYANLRKNNTFTLLQSGDTGIPTNSLSEHQITLVKQANHIRLYIDERKVIDYVDNSAVVDGVETGPPLQGGKIGFRQMKWTQFQYSNFNVWSIE